MAPTQAEKLAAKKKADERRARNLQAANISRQRRREEISSLEQERARLREANELLRARLNISSSATLGAGKLPPGISAPSGKVPLGPAMRKLTNRAAVDGAAAVDLLDRAISGSKGKGPPVDPALVKLWQDAAKKAPKDVQRPYQYYEKGGSSGQKKGSSSKDKGSSSKAPSSSKKSKK